MRSPTSRSLDELIAYQVHRWEQAEARREMQLQPRAIALSRLPGSGAAELGLRVAETLGFGFFGIEIVERIAGERGVQRELVAGLDEHVRAAIDRWVVDAFRAHPFTESEYLRQVVRVVATLGQRGMAVILGRGSAYILPAERTLRLLVVAPREARIERLAKARNLSQEVAAARLEDEERERQTFIRHHFHLDPDDPARYDLVVNPATLGMDAAVDLVVAAFRARFSNNS